MRERLEEVTKDGLQGITTEEQIKIIEGLLGRESLPWDLLNHNCFAYALGLHKSEKYVGIATSTPSTSSFANSQFVKYLLGENVLKELITPHEGCIIFYFDEVDTPKHAGIVKSNDLTQSFYVESKWGTFQKLFLHEIWDVPSSYGNVIKYYTLPEIEKVERCFIKYCRL